MDNSYFYDESDKEMFPAKPKLSGRPKGMVTISLNFVFYILIYFLVFRGNLKLLAAVMLVMFIHEFGHFVMMRRYGYNDKKLFFVPFLSMFLGDEEGQVSLKEKLFVLFAGPVPGILIGIAAFYFGHVQQNEQMTLLGWIFLTWNLVNLFPLEVLDGGHISTTLFPKSNFVIQIVATAVLTLGVIAFVLLTNNFLALIIPVFLAFRLQAMSKMNVLRKKLEDKGLDLDLNYEELNNKQYWLIRKELLTLSSLPAMNESADEMSESIYEGLIMQNIRTVLLNTPYNDLGKNGKVIFAFVWMILMLAPIAFVVLYSLGQS